MATFRKRGLYQWQAQVRKKSHPLQTRTFDTRAAAEIWARAIDVEMDKGVFVSRAEVESTTLKELLERYLAEVTPLKKGAGPETARIRALLRHPLSQRIVGSIRGVDIARYRNERLKKVLVRYAAGTNVTARHYPVLAPHTPINPTKNHAVPPTDKSNPYPPCACAVSGSPADQN